MDKSSYQTKMMGVYAQQCMVKRLPGHKDVLMVPLTVFELVQLREKKRIP